MFNLKKYSQNYNNRYDDSITMHEAVKEATKQFSDPREQLEYLYRMVVDRNIRISPFNQTEFQKIAKPIFDNYLSIKNHQVFIDLPFTEDLFHRLYENVDKESFLKEIESGIQPSLTHISQEILSVAPKDFLQIPSERILKLVKPNSQNMMLSRDILFNFVPTDGMTANKDYVKELSDHNVTYALAQLFQNPENAIKFPEEFCEISDTVIKNSYIFERENTTKFLLENIPCTEFLFTRYFLSSYAGHELSTPFLINTIKNIKDQLSKEKLVFKFVKEYLDESYQSQEAFKDAFLFLTDPDIYNTLLKVENLRQGFLESCDRVLKTQNIKFSEDYHKYHLSSNFKVPENYTKQKLLSAKNKEEIFNISNQILQLKNSPDKQKANNQIGKLLSILKTKFNITQPILNQEQLDNFINFGKKEFPHNFVTKQREWNQGQQFINDKSDEVFLIYPDYNFLKEIEADKDLKNLFSSGNHFTKQTDPIGWALVHKLNPDTWVINQIQSDVFAEMKHRINQTNQAKPITQDELVIRLNAAIDETTHNINRAEFINAILNMTSAKDFILKYPPVLHTLFKLSIIDRIKEYTLLSTKNQIETLGISESVAQEKKNKIEKNLYDQLKSYAYSNDLQDNSYNQEQLANLQNKLGYLLKEWPLIVFHNVWNQAKKEGVKHLYFNTPNTVAGGLSDEAKKIYYESLPKSLGFEKQKANLRTQPNFDNEGNGEEVPHEEEFWYRQANRDKSQYHSTLSDKSGYRQSNKSKNLLKLSIKK